MHPFPLLVKRSLNQRISNCFKQANGSRIQCVENFAHKPKLPYRGIYMYLVAIILLLLVFPVGSIAVEVCLSGHASGLMFLMGIWFVLGAAGGRLFLHCQGDFWNS